MDLNSLLPKQSAYIHFSKSRKLVGAEAVRFVKAEVTSYQTASSGGGYGNGLYRG